MTRRGAAALSLIVLAELACQLRRPDVPPVRMIEPELLAPQASPRHDAAPTPIRLLDTQARAHIGRKLLHREPNGELTSDPVWHWSSTPDRYLDSALRLAFGSSADLRLVDAGSAATLAVTLTEWHLEAPPQLVGAIELAVTAEDRTVTTHMIRKVQPVSSELPGDLAGAAGRLLNELAAESLVETGKDVRR
jgi:hypothetical protein